MGGQYARDTTVSVSASQTEIERILQRYGATSFMRGWDQEKAVLMFKAYDRNIKMVLQLPMRSEFAKTETGRSRTSAVAIDTAYEQACRQRWRALALVVKAKLEAVEAGISTFENEFMAHIMLPNGQTTGEFMTPQIELAYLANTMPLMLTVGSGKE